MEATKTINKYLEQITDKQIKHIDFKTALDGIIDLSLLKQYNFNNVKHISFAKGQISFVKNIPDGVEILDMRDNAITSLPHLPSSLLTLNIENNLITYVTLETTPKIKILHASNNSIEAIENIPETVEELYINNNKIKLLDLHNVKKLRVLHCSNNQLLVLKNAPDNIPDYVCENSPLANLQNLTEGDKEEQQIEKDIQQKINYIDSLRKYFQLKSEYENNLLKKRKATFKDAIKKGLSKQAALRKVQAIKPQCINCKRPVGTFFGKRNDRYVATCNDTQSPCNLNIEIFNGMCIEIMDYLKLLQQDNEVYKEQIIREKMDTVFSYIDEDAAYDKFKKLLEKYTMNKKDYDEMIEKYNTLHFGEQRKQIIENKTQKIYNLIRDVKILLKEYSGSSNRELLHTAMQKYIEDIVPENKNLMRVKYDNMELINGDFLQTEVDFSRTFENIQEPRVINFVKK